MKIYTCDPLTDPRWALVAASHPSSSAFHTVAWLEALHRTYGYEAVVYTTSAPNSALTNAIVLCRVRSWLTGRRIVSVPFADHCDPLVEGIDEGNALLDALEVESSHGWRYVELRPLNSAVPTREALRASESFWYHTLDLRPAVDVLFRRLHPSTIQRKIRRAEKEGVTCVEGRSDALLQEFFRLMVATRRRHGVPPQPIAWFRNLLAAFGEHATIRVAFLRRRAIASILTLQHRQTLVYKYGCSDARAHRSGAMPMLFWTTIQAAKNNGVLTLDLGRSDLANTGLVTFKDRLGGSRSTISYIRFAGGERSVRARRLRVPRSLVARLPDRMLAAAGALLYRHMG